MSMSNRRSVGVMCGIVALAALVRLAAIAPRVGAEAEDPDHYLILARSLAEGRGFTLATKPTAYRPPLYPLMLAPIARSLEPIRVVPQVWGPLAVYPMTWPIAALHAGLGAIAAALTMLAARRWGLTMLGVAASGLVVALDPLLVAQSRSIMTETLAATLLAWALAAARGGMRGAAESGLAFGLAALCRPSTLACAGVAIVFAAFLIPGGRRRRWGSAGLMLAVVAATVFPWAARNRMAFGEFVWTTTHGGYTLALANNRWYYQSAREGRAEVWDPESQRAWAESIAKATAGLGEPEADRAMTRLGWGMLETQPRDFLRASLARIARFWAVAPSSAVYGLKVRMLSAAWTTPLLALSLLGLMQRETWRWPRIVAPATLIGLSCVHLIYWTDMRMRAPLVPAIALLAAVSALKKNGGNFRNPRGIALPGGTRSVSLKGAALGGPD